MYISQIKWPSNEREAVNILLKYLLKVIDVVDIELPDYFNDVILKAKQFHNGNLSREEYSDECDKYWTFIDRNNAASVFNNQEVLHARLAISLLSADRNIGEASLAVDWFIELLEMLEVDPSIPMRLLDEHFEQRGNQ